MAHRRRHLLLAVLAIAPLGSIRAESPSVRDVLPKIPAETNALLLIDVQALYRSPLARQEGWERQHAADYLEGKLLLPPETSLFVLSTDLKVDFAGVRSGWQTGVALPLHFTSLASLARRENGVVETIAGHQVVLSPRGFYHVSFGDQLHGIHYTALRPDLARWLQFCHKNKKPVISDWLQHRADELRPDTPLILAIHLENAVDANLVRQQLQVAQAAFPPGTDLDRLAQLLASVKGLRWKLQVTTELRGELRFEFNQPAKPFRKLLHLVLAHALPMVVDGLPNLKSWHMEVEEKAVVFRGAISTEAFTHFLEKLQPPPATTP